ncbi:MAG: hypothetical protein M3Q99_01320 [Acidobacteriota bacterium]|nr:hypothetical protein [Acidobacteriota bacterium]
MPNIFFDNLHLWQKQTDIDYFTHFMKTWLVFNAWMYHSTHSEKDRDNIDFVKEENNTFRAKMMSFVRLNDSDSNKFREHIGNLHLALETSIQINKGEELRFSNAYIGKNPTRIDVKYSRGCEFKVELSNIGNNTNTVSITRGVAAILNLTNPTYDLTWLENHADFIALTQERKGWITACYKVVNPKLYKNLTTLDFNDCIKCGTIHFINDDDLVCKGLIEMLYRLRCILFHGELST